MIILHFHLALIFFSLDMNYFIYILPHATNSSRMISCFALKTNIWPTPRPAASVKDCSQNFIK